MKIPDEIDMGLVDHLGRKHLDGSGNLDGLRKELLWFYPVLADDDLMIEVLGELMKRLYNYIIEQEISRYGSYLDSGFIDEIEIEDLDTGETFGWKKE